MKRAVLVLGMLWSVLVFSSCESRTAHGTLYLHRLTLDRDEGGYILHALVSGDVANTDGLAAETEADAEEAVWMTYGGKTPTEPFEAFLTERGHLYTATLEGYEWGTGLTDADIKEVYLYLMDTPAWPIFGRQPAKEPPQFSSSPRELLASANAKVICAEPRAPMDERRTENRVRRL